MKNPAFMIIDAERCFYPVEEGKRLGRDGFGALGVPGAEKINPCLDEMTDFAQWAGIPIVHTLDKHPAKTAHFSDTPNYQDTWPAHGVDGTSGSLLHPNLMIARNPVFSTEFIKGDKAVRSPKNDTSYTGALAHRRGETEVLPDYLRRRKVRAVIIGGLALGDGAEHPLCVDSTAIDFKRLGFDVVVLTDATEAVLPGNKAKSLRNMGRLGIRLMTAAEARTEIMQPRRK